MSGHQQTRWDAKSINFLSRLTHDLMMPVKPGYRVQGTHMCLPMFHHEGGHRSRSSSMTERWMC